MIVIFVLDAVDVVMPINEALSAIVQDNYAKLGRFMDLYLC